MVNVFIHIDTDNVEFVYYLEFNRCDPRAWASFIQKNGQSPRLPGVDFVLLRRNSEMGSTAAPAVGFDAPTTSAVRATSL